jgi:Amt family ammonium transporter
VLLHQVQAAQDAATTNDIDSLWVLNGAFLVFFMQTGFAALEVGSVRSIGAINVLLKNMVDNCVGSLIWWLVGYMLAFGPDLFDKGFIGGKSWMFFGGIQTF